VLIVDLKFGQGFRELVQVVLGIGARPRNGPDINDKLTSCGLSKSTNSRIERVECPMVKNG
jgi:hypothetical protein